MREAVRWWASSGFLHFNPQLTTPISQPLFSHGTECLFRDNPSLVPSRTRELAAEFIAAQAEVCRLLGALSYPLQRVMQEIHAGHLPHFREGSDQDRKEGCRKAAYRFAGFTPTHQADFEREAGAVREGRLARPAFSVWQADFLRRFTFEVLEQVAVRALPAPDLGAEGSGPLRRELNEALAAARRQRDQILRGNLLLAAQIAIRRGRCHAVFSLDDLFAAGTDGLLIAINRYDPAVASFSTYATPWIQMAIDRFAAKNRHVIRIPIGLQEKARKSGEAAALIPQVQSLEEPLPGSDEEMRLEDVVSDPAARPPLETVERADISARLADGLAQLSPLKQLIVALRSDVGDAAALGARLFQEEMDLSLARGRAIAAAAARTLDEPARIRIVAPPATLAGSEPAEAAELPVAV
ncbi:MAG TPA: sigma-70 family RNA polymerase sigma factor [Opitutaceae bacterium]|nr:sigma-70 family RNA polymerase sigma factor [Opitutaceae bacterium]